MSGQSTAIIGAGAAVAATITTGPLEQIVSDLSLALAFWGAMGGLLMGLWERQGWADIARSVASGALLTFGLGQALPHVLSWMLGDQLGQAISGGGLGGMAFTVGLMQTPVLSRFMAAARRSK